MKIKKMFKRYICYILVLALLFSSVPVYSVSAAETENTFAEKLKEAASEAAEAQKEYADQLAVCRTNWNDLTITFKGINDKLVIAGYFTSESNRKFNVKFADGVQIAFDDADNPIRQIFETEYNH